jgi:hypothetical protein
VIWSIFEKDTKEIRKQKKKRKEKKNMKKAAGKPFGPVPEKAHGPPEHTEAVPSSFSFSH